MITEDQNKTLLELTVQIVSAHLTKNQVPAQGLPSLIEQVYGALSRAGAEPAAPPAEKQQPFVPAKRSVFPDYIICLEDGRKLKTLKRHLRSTFGLSPEQYREKWGLAADYPMVAPNYAEHRSRLAKELGLGRKPTGEDEPAPRREAAAARQAASAARSEPADRPESREAETREAGAREAAGGREGKAEPTRDVKEGRRRGEPTAASVFAKFPKNAPEVAPEAAPAAGKKTRGRKPFSKQLARTMRQ